MEFLTEKRGSNEFFSCKISEAELDDFACQMFGANVIPYFLPFSVVHRDDEVYVEYNISGLKDMESIVTAVITRKRLVSILSGFINAYTEAEDFMLDAEKVLLDREHVFYNRLTETIKLIYLPTKEDTVDDLSSMQYLAQLLKNLRFDARDIELENSVKTIIGEIESGNIENLAGLKSIQNNLNLTDDKDTSDDESIEEKLVTDELEKAKRNAELVKENPLKSSTAEFVIPSLANENAVEEESSSKPKKGLGLNIPGIEIPGFGKKEDKKEAKKGVKKDIKKRAAPSKPSGKSALGFSIPGKEDPIPGQVEEPEEEVKPAKADSKKKKSFAVPGISGIPNIPGISKRENKKEEPVVKAAPKPVKKEQILEVDELTDDTEGTVIGGTVMTNARLTPANGGGAHYIDAATFSIGRSQTCSLVLNNSQVSRTHATIERINDEYYVTDQKSSNHTYLNGKELTPNMPVKLSDGDQLRFSKETYIFNL